MDPEVANKFSQLFSNFTYNLKFYILTLKHSFFPFIVSIFYFLYWCINEKFIGSSVKIILAKIYWKLLDILEKKPGFEFLRRNLWELNWFPEIIFKNNFLFSCFVFIVLSVCLPKWLERRKRKPENMAEWLTIF